MIRWGMVLAVVLGPQLGTIEAPRGAFQALPVAVVLGAAVRECLVIGGTEACDVSQRTCSVCRIWQFHEPAPTDAEAATACTPIGAVQECSVTGVIAPAGPRVIQ